VTSWQYRRRDAAALGGLADAFPLFG